MPTVEREGLLIHYEVTGRGPVVLLHTGAGGDGTMWHRAGYVDALGRHHRVIVIDHRGHGRSGRPALLSQHGVDDYVADALAVADACEAERFTWIGYSDGASLGFRAAATRGDRIRALVALGDIGRPDEPMAERAERAARLRDDGIGPVLSALERGEPGIPAWFMDQMRATDPAMFANELEGWSSWDGPWSELGAVKCPVLLLVGELEEEPSGAALRHAQEAQRLLADARAEAIPGVGHCGLFCAATAVLTSVQPFLAQALAR